MQPRLLPLRRGIKRKKGKGEKRKSLFTVLQYIPANYPYWLKSSVAAICNPVNHSEDQMSSNGKMERVFWLCQTVCTLVAENRFVALSVAEIFSSLRLSDGSWREKKGFARLRRAKFQRIFHKFNSKPRKPLLPLNSVTFNIWRPIFGVKPPQDKMLSSEWNCVVSESPLNLSSWIYCS